MLKKIAMMAAFCALPFSMTVSAADNGRSIEQVYKECGIGAMIFGKSSPTLAFISNVTWDLGTTAAVSNSMSPDTCSGGKVRTAMLIKEAFPSVEKDLAAGNGAHLSALNTFMACDAAAADLRTEYANYTLTQAYAQSSEKQNAEALYSIVNRTAASAGCSL